MNLKISRSSDGALVLSCGTKGMETDLVFASGAMIDEDPLLAEQRAILDRIVSAAQVLAVNPIEWQLIETAPKDGTLFLAYEQVEQFDTSPDRFACQWGTDGWLMLGGNDDCQAFPTHWIPMPAPPSIA